jgi:gamma-glutamyltranspeptidase/glutathione hydrolase
VAPAVATIGRFRELGLDLIAGTGLLAACVPGAFGAWMRLLRDHGTMPLADILGPAIAYAERGYPAVGRIGETIATVAELFRREWPTSAAVYLPNSAPPQPGRLFRNPALAATYRRVLAETADGGRERQIERARQAWYQGFVAEVIDRFCRHEKVLDASGRRHGGLLTADDMARWEATVEAPITIDYLGYTVAKGGPWSQGPVLLQQLALLRGFDLDGLDPLGPDFVHLVVECAKLAFADREAWYGDRDYVDVIDRWGNMVSATPSGGWLQSSPVIPELGFCLGTRMQMFWLEEGLPASLAPGKRPRSTLSPSMAFRDGKPYLAFGTPGGDQQDQWSALMVLHHVHHGMNLQEAIDCPAFHSEHMPSSFYPRTAQPGLLALESRFPDATRAELARRGHRLRVGEPWSEGRLSGCAREDAPEGRVLKAAANPRGMQGYAIGR